VGGEEFGKAILPFDAKVFCFFGWAVLRFMFAAV